MLRKISFLVCVFLAAAIWAQSPTTSPPATKVSPVKEIHQVAIEDPYRWLEEDNDEVRQWIDEQNRYTASLLDRRVSRSSIKKRLKSLLSISSFSLPAERNGRYFYTERGGQVEYYMLYYQDGLGGPPIALIDPTTISKGGSLKEWSVSQDGRLVAYSFSDVGNDAATLRVREVASGKDLPDVIPDVYFCNPVWSDDGSGFWYTRSLLGRELEGNKKLDMKVYFHRLGSEWQDDRLVFGENLGREDAPLANLSYNERWLVVMVWALSKGMQNEVYILDRNNPDKGFVAVFKDVSALCEPHVHGNKLYLRTNYKASQWRLLVLDLESLDPQKDNPLESASEVIPETKHVLESCAFLGDRIFVEHLVNGLSELTIYDTAGKFLMETRMPVAGALGGFSVFSDELFLSFSSFFFPETIFRYDAKTGEWSLFKKAEVDIESSQFVMRQIWFNSRDGARVPMFVLHKNGIELNGRNPTLLYGYGGFNISSTPSFDKDAVLFLERGGVYVIANIRGGGEFGEDWHRAGMLSKKQNVFDDFIAAAEWLIASKYTSPDKLAIFGWSNGGLLTATVMAQRPELFKAVVIGAPVLDMLRFHKFHWGRYWIKEYGDPESPDDLRHLLAYSPYHNVRDGLYYPATLILTADSDDRVGPFHAYKMAARLQVANGSRSPILLRVEKDAGHGGATSVSQSVEVYTDMWSFVFWQLGME